MKVTCVTPLGEEVASTSSPFEALQSVPEAYATAEQNRDHHSVHVVDEPSSKEVADHGGTSADAYVLAVRGLPGSLERLGQAKRR